MGAYWTVIIPHVLSEFRTEWHPSEAHSGSDLFRVLSRGAFETEREAIVWAREHLNGTPYNVRYMTGEGT